MRTMARIFLLLFGFLALPAIAQTAQRYTVPFATAFDSTGVVSPGALLHFYLTGTSTPVNTYSDASLVTPNANPVVANGAGLFPNIFLSPGQQYKVVLADAQDNQIWTADPVYSQAGGYVITVASIAALQAIGTSSPSFGSAIVQGSRGGIFNWTSGSICNASTGGGDGGTTFCATSGAGYVTSGYWLRQYNGDLYTNWWDTGANDIGAQWNGAYAALPVSGGVIRIPNPVSGNSYTWTTAMVETTKGKCAMTYGPQSSSFASGSVSKIYLNWTANTGSAWTRDCSDSNNATANQGIYGLAMTNANCANSCSGTTAIGIDIGVTNGGDSAATYQNVTIAGFGTGYRNLNPNVAVSGQTFYNPQLLGNVTALSIYQSPTAVYGGNVLGNGTIFKQPPSSVGSGITFFGTIFASNTATHVFDYTDAGAIATSGISLIGAHVENNPSVGCEFIAGNVNVTIAGGSLGDDSSSGTCPWMIQETQNNGVLSIVGTTISSSRTVTAIVDTPAQTFGNLDVVMTSGAALTQAVSGTFSSLLNSHVIRNQSSLQVASQSLQPQFFEDIITYGLVNLTPLQTAHPCNSTNKGARATVLDALSPTYHSIVVNGGSQVTGVVCDGTNYIAE